MPTNDFCQKNVVSNIIIFKCTSMETNTINPDWTAVQSGMAKGRKDKEEQFKQVLFRQELLRSRYSVQDS